MKNIYFVFENNKECKYYYKNVLAELIDDYTYYTDNKNLTITKTMCSIKKANILKRIFYLLKKSSYTSFKFKSITYNFVNTKNFSAENKDINDVYYFREDNNDYTDYILDIINGVR